MTLSDTQRAILEAALRHPDGLATPPAHLPPAARTAIARSLMRTGLLAEAPDTGESEANPIWRVDGADLTLRITGEGRRAIGDQTEEKHGADEPEASPIRHVPEVSTTAGTGSTPTRSLRQAARALLIAWDDDTSDRAGVPEAVERLRAVLMPATPRPRLAGERRPPREGTKQALVLAMLRRPEGATVADIAAAMDWAPHTVRGFFAGLKTRQGIVVEAERVRQVGPGKEGARGSFSIYRVVETN